MNNQTLHCCQNNPIFLITYRIGSKFYVCNHCLSKKIWNRAIQKKKPVTKINGQGRPHSISEQELATYG